MPPPLEQVFLASPAVTARGRVITSPFQFQFTGEDRIVIVSTSSVDAAFTARFRFQQDDGAINVIQQNIQAVGDRIPHLAGFSMGHGFVSNLVIQPNSSAVEPGELYVTVYVARTGGTAPGLIVGQLLGGYTTRNQSLAWPGSPIVEATEGQGKLLSLNVGTLLPGVAVTLDVPTNTRWALKTIYGDFQSAVGANVLIYCVMLAGGIVIARVPAPAEQATATTVRYTWGRGLQHYGMQAGLLTTLATAPLPVETIIPAGNQILLTKDNPSNLFTWLNVGAQVQEWLSP